MKRVTLYSKPECHLCDVVKDVIARVRARREFELELRNIEDDPADFEKYRNDIPVVIVDGREIARHALSRERLEWALDLSLRLVVMTKFPEAGKVKTRLQPALSADQAARVHRVFLGHVCGRLLELGELVVCFDPPDSEKRMREILPRVREFIPQTPGDLGARMAAAFRSLGGESAMFFGVDSPDVPLEHVSGAIKLLNDHDVVLGPSEDGGFWCLGLANSVDAEKLLERIEWSSGRELRQTRERAESLGYRVALARSWDDIDRPEDLQRLVTRLQKSDNAADMQLLDQLGFLPHGASS